MFSQTVPSTKQDIFIRIDILNKNGIIEINTEKYENKIIK